VEQKEGYEFVPREREIYRGTFYMQDLYTFENRWWYDLESDVAKYMLDLGHRILVDSSNRKSRPVTILFQGENIVVVD
jgi:hypothetical protein